MQSHFRMQNLELSESPKETDVVIQVRLCDGPVHQYKYYSWKNYFSHVLPRLQPPPKRIKIVTTCNPRRNGVVKDLLENVPNAEPARRRRRARNKSSKGDDDDDAIPMGFGVGHPSFKAAFPESASWDK